MGAPRFNFSDDRRMVEVTGTLADLANWYQSYRPNDLNAGNEHALRHVTGTTDYNGFAQGTHEDLVRPLIDFRQFEQARALMRKSGLLDKIRESMGGVRKRRRSKSEHDGEWDFDARWDIRPFTRRQVNIERNRVINIEVHGSYSAGVDGKQINAFGAYVTALVELIEARGIMVSVRTVHGADHITTDGKLNYRMRTLVKSTDQLLIRGDLLKAMGANYYRRVAFLGKVAAAHLEGKAVTAGLGKVVIHQQQWSVDAETGTLSLYSQPFPEEQYGLLTKLLHLIKEGK